MMSILALATWMLAGHDGQDYRISISGTVFAYGDPSRVLPGATVTASVESDGTRRIAVSDSKGHYALSGLPKSPVQLSASKPGFLTTAYGASYVGEKGVTLTPNSLGAEAAGIDIALLPAGTITGSVTNHRGEGLPGVVVSAERAGDGSRSGKRLATTVTDRYGVYRLEQLEPGTFVVLAEAPASMRNAAVGRNADDVDRILAALAAGTPPASERSRTFAYVTSYAPGLWDRSAASRIRLAVGERRDAVTIELEPAPLVVLSGTISPLPMPSATARVLLVAVDGSRAQEALATPDGHFSFSGVAPGSYFAVAVAPTGLRGSSAVTISDSDLGGVDVEMTPPVSLAGRVSGGPAALGASLTPLTLSVTTPEERALAMAGRLGLIRWTGASSRVRPQEDGSFHITGLHQGTCQVEVDVPRGWSLRSVTQGGRELTDGQCVISRAGTELGPIQVDLVKATSALRGTVSGQRPGLSAPYVVAMRRKSKAGDRAQVVFTRSSADGSYSLTGLEAGQYDVAVVWSLAEEDLEDSGFVATLLSLSVSQVLTDGEQKELNLRIGSET